MASEKFDLSVILRFIDKASPGMKKFGRGLAAVGKKMGQTAKRGAKVGAVMGTAFGTLAIKKTAEYQGVMNMVGAVTNATTEEFKKLSDTAKTLGATTQFSAVDAAKAMQFMGMAGLQTNKILEASPKVLQLAAAAQLDMGSSADIVTNIMAGFGDEAGGLAKVNDVLVKAFTSSNVNLQQMGEGLKKVGPVASKLGFEFTETAAALGLLGSAGFQGQEAGVGLRRIMSNVIAPTKGQQKAMKFLELELRNADGSAKSLVGVLGEFEKAQKKGATQSQIAAGALEIFGQRGGPQLLALLGQGSEALAKLKIGLDESGGTAQRVADAQMKGLPGAMKEIASAWEAVQLAFGEGATGKLIENTIRGIATAMREFAPTMELISGKIVTIVETLTAFPAAFKNFFDSTFGKIADGFRSFITEWNAEWRRVWEAIPKPIRDWMTSSKVAVNENTKPANLASAGSGLAGAAKSYSEVLLKVHSAPGTQATVEQVSTKGSTNLNVENKTVVGPTLAHAFGYRG